MKVLGVTCVRHEGPWLLDWIAHHQSAGFTHFLIASHDCDDGTDRLLDLLDQAGIVTHISFKPEGEKSVQWQAMKRLSKSDIYRNADLALFFDVDEFLGLEGVNSVTDLIPDGKNAMPLRWRQFGHSGHSEWLDRPVTERFTRSAPDNIALPSAHFFKTLHRPAAFRELGVHRPKGKVSGWIGADGTPMPDTFEQTQARINLFGLPQGPAKAWLNHYSVRSIDEFILKTTRGLPNHMDKQIGLGYWAERNFNTQSDTRITPMIDAARHARAALGAFDEQHNQCLGHHRHKLAQLLRQKAVIELKWQLTLLAGSTPPSPAILSAHLTRLRAYKNET